MHSPYLFNSIYMLFIHCILLYFLINNKKRGFLFQQNYFKNTSGRFSGVIRVPHTHHTVRNQEEIPILPSSFFRNREREKERKSLFFICHPPAIRYSSYARSRVIVNAFLVIIFCALLLDAISIMQHE